MKKDLFNGFLNKVEGDRQGLDMFLAALRHGENVFSHNSLTQTVQMDDDWIIEIEKSLNSVEQIVHRPRKFITDNETVLDVARVRRTTNKTVRHLTTHSQFVNNYDKDTGEVTPKKLLSVEMEEELAIYENRFVCALINNLIKFVETRNDEIKDRIESFNQTQIKMQSKFSYGGSNFDCDISVKVSDPVEDENQNKKNVGLYDRIQVLRRRLRILQSTEFVKELSRAKPVRPPIQKTNLLMKNVDYNNCYKLWLFISSYRYLGCSVSANMKSLPVEGDYFDDMTVLLGLTLQSMLANEVINRKKYEAIDYSTMLEKDYKVINKFEFKPQFDDSPEDCGSDTINEYYYRKIKDELVKDATDEDYLTTHVLNVNFAKFFRSISRINDAMYSDLIDDVISSDDVDEETLKSMSVKAKQKRLVKQQKERVKRRKLYLKLKWEELERAQRVLDREEAKFYALKDEYDGVVKPKKTKKFTSRKYKVLKDD